MYKLIAGASAAALLGACAATTEPTVADAATQPTVQAASGAEIERLNDFVSVMIDAETLYEQASDLPDNEEGVSMALASIAEDREDQREYLQARIEALGGTADQYGEAVGTTHRVFTQIRSAFSDDSEVAIEEVLRGERYIVTQIGEIMTTGPTDDTAELLASIRSDVMEDIEMLEDLDKVA